MTNNTNWEKEKEQASQELKDNRIFQVLFKAVIDLSQENKELKNHLENLRDINRTTKQKEPSTNSETIENIKKEKLKRMEHAVNERDHLQVYQGKPLCGFCKEQMGNKWSQKHIYYSCNPACAERFEQIIFQATYLYWQK